METVNRGIYIVSPKKRTRILPTRNGNLSAPGIPKSLTLDTDPTYKEWKLKQQYSHNNQPLFQHGSYLQGMETYQLAVEERKLETAHGSYLQGMETRKAYRRGESEGNTHGSYLQGMETPRRGFPIPEAVITRILPTRNGNGFITSDTKVLLIEHGSYLQGMET